jgi:hypothetical protein
MFQEKNGKQNQRATNVSSHLLPAISNGSVGMVCW